MLGVLMLPDPITAFEYATGDHVRLILDTGRHVPRTPAHRVDGTAPTGGTRRRAQIRAWWQALHT
ncbi:hypothetical protein [Streptomyces sp. DW26H14]|uniref:hypothetical protein n=1 Tax=Streptomyces sp. DW26H14 TaxID=3435395 RepID=UPI00403D6614